MGKVTNDPAKYVKRSHFASRHIAKSASAAALTHQQKVSLSREFGKSGEKKAGFIPFGTIIRR